MLAQFAWRRCSSIDFKVLVQTEHGKSKHEVKISDSMLIL